MMATSSRDRGSSFSSSCCRCVKQQADRHTDTRTEIHTDAQTHTGTSMYMTQVEQVRLCVRGVG